MRQRRSLPMLVVVVVVATGAGIALGYGLARDGARGGADRFWDGGPEYSLRERDGMLAVEAVRRGDFPRAWKVQFLPSREIWTEFARCVDFSDLHATGRSPESDHVTSGRDGASARGFVLVFMDEKDAVTAFERVAASGRCVADAIVHGAAEYPVEEIVDVDFLRHVGHETRPFPAVGDDRHAFLVRVRELERIGSAGLDCDPEVALDYVILRVRRALALLVFRSVREPRLPGGCERRGLPAGLPASVARAVAARLRRV